MRHLCFGGQFLKMSTNRNISTLPLDALRSTTSPRDSTAEGQEQRPYDRNTNTDNSFSRSATINNLPRVGVTNRIGMKNLQLYRENEKLRRCLELFMENSDLRTMNMLSSVMSMYDDKLRKFMTETLVDNSSNAIRVGASIASDYMSPTQTLKKPNASTMGYNSYGKSFQELELNDLLNSTTQDYPTRSTKISPSRRRYSPGLSPGSVRPPMKFGFGKSPYQKPSEKSILESSSYSKPLNSSEYLDSSKRISSIRPLLSNRRSTSIETNSQTEDGQQRKNIYQRPSSAPSPIRKLVYNTRPFKMSNASAFSPVKSGKRCKECGARISPCFCHSARDKDSGTIAMENTIGSPPKYINEYTKTSNIRTNQTSVSQNKTPVKNYQANQTSLYDSVAANLDKFFDKSQLNAHSTVTQRPIKRHLAKSVNFTDAPRSRDVKYTENFGRDENIRADPKRLYNHGTQTTFANISTSTSRELDEQLTVDYGRIGEPKATSTPVARQQFTSTTKDEGFSGGKSSWKALGSPISGCEPDKYCQCNEGGTVLSYGNENIDEIGNTNYPAEQFSPDDMKTSLNHLSSASLANIMGIRGSGAVEKAKYILHRPVDILVGYYPEITEEVGMILARSIPNKRVIGEIAFQLDRRILEFVFARATDVQYDKRRSRYYGYSVASIMLLIAKEVRLSGNDPEVDLNLRMRLEHVLETLQRLGYDLDRHSEFTQDVVNKYGLLNGTPVPGTVEDIGLREPAVMRVVLGLLITDAQELDDALIILDCLQYMAHKDKGAMFIW